MRLTKTLLISAVLLMSATGMQAAGFNQNGNYLTVQLKQHQNFGPSQIRLQVVSDKIIRVQATAEQSFRNKQSLIIVPQNSKANYKVEEQGGRAGRQSHHYHCSYACCHERGYGSDYLL